MLLFEKSVKPYGLVNEIFRGKFLKTVFLARYRDEHAEGPK